MTAFRTIQTPGPQPQPYLSLVDRGLAACGFRKLALRRSAARYEYEATRWYLESAKTDRTTADWRKISAYPDQVALSDAALTRSRIRAAVQNNGYACHAKDVLLDWTVGTGIKTQCQMFYSRDPKEQSKLTSFAESRKERWMDQADALNQLHWYEMQRLFLGEIIEAGDAYLYRRFVTHTDRFGKPRTLPLAYEFIASERLVSFGSIGVQAGNDIVNGVEIDPSGLTVAYHVDTGQWYRSNIVRIPAADMIHGYRQDRPGQHVGISWFAPVLSDLNYLHDILFYRLVAAKVQSAVSVLVSEDPNGGSRPPLPGLTPVSGAKGTTTNGDRQRFLEPGLIHNVGTGKVTPFIPNPSSDLDPVTRLVLRGVAVGIGTSYELLTGDYSQVNFAGGRLVRQDSRRRNLPVHSFVCRRLEDPVHHEWCDAELAFGAMRPPRDLETLYDVRYSQPKSDEGVNPTQDASAAAQRLALGISTLREEVEARGGDWQEYLEQITSERTYGKDLGMLIHEALFVPTDTTPGESA